MNKHLGQKLFTFTTQLQACYFVEKLVLVFHNDSVLCEKLYT